MTHKGKVLFFALLLLSRLVGACPPALAETVTYEYDPLNRLTHVVYGGGPGVAYTYDASGNRIARTVHPPLAGDVLRDGVLDLRDAVLTLQTCASLPGNASVAADASGDGRIGTEEALYLLRTIADR